VICRIDGAAVGFFVGRYPKALIGGQRWCCHILFTIFHGTARRAQPGWCAQPYATAQSVCHLPIEQLMKKIESRMPIFFEDCSFQNKTFTKLSPSSDFCEP
jgi:hypothetical protein